MMKPPETLLAVCLAIPCRVQLVMTFWGKYMTPQGRKIWGSKEGQSLMEAMLKGKPPTPEQKEVVKQLKESSNKDR